MENETQGNDYALKFLTDMEAKYAALGNAIASVRAALNIGALGGLGIGPDAASAMPAASGSSGTALPRGAFLGKTISEGVRLYLNAIRARKTNKEIAQALKDGGAVSTGNFENRVTGTLFQLKNRGEVLRFDDGWGLAEWYPESFRTRITEKSATPQKRRTKKKLTAGKAKRPETPKESGGTHVSLDQRIDALLRGEPSRVLSLQEIARALDVKAGSLTLSLSRLAAKGKALKLPGGYQAGPGNISAMAS